MKNDFDINAVRTGPRGGPPIVLLHSAGLDLTYWDQQMETLRGEYDTVALDLPGHGLSGGTPVDITADKVAAKIASAMTALDGGPVHLIGLSVGGLIAQTIALRFPHLVRSLGLLDTAANFDDAVRRSMRARAHTVRRDGMAAIVGDLVGHWFTPATLAERPYLADRATKTVLHDDPDVQGALWEMIAAHDAVHELPGLSVPTIVLVGEHDSSSPVASARRLCDLITHAELHVVADAAHLSPIEQPTDVNGHLLGFLRSVDGAV